MLAPRSSVEAEGERLIEGPPVVPDRSRLTPADGVREIEEGDRGVWDGVRSIEGTESREIEGEPGVRVEPPEPRLNSFVSDGERLTEGACERPMSELPGRPLREESMLRERSVELNGDREIEGARSGELNRESLPADGRFT